MWITPAASPLPPSSQEAAATDANKVRLATLCEQLVLFRERLDDQRMDQLYLSTLDMLAGSPVPELRPPAAGDSAQGEDELAATAMLKCSPSQEDVAMMRQRREEAVALLASSPEIYAVELSKRLTGAPILSEGYPNPLFDLIIQVCIRATRRRGSPCIPPCSQAHPAALPL